MKNIILPAVLLTVAASLRAGEQVVAVTPQSLRDWTVVGAETSTLAQATSLALPAGAQLARSFSAADVAVQLVTRPVFGANAADWPVLELGITALVFQRDGAEGKLAIALGDAAPLALPFVVALDAEGRSAAPLVLDFIRRGSTVTVTLGGQTLQFPDPLPAMPSMEVIASAGAGQAWAFETMAVTVATSDVRNETGQKTPDKNSAAGPPDAAGKISATDATSASAGAAENNHAPGGEVKSSSAVPSSSHGGGLEIFTPPSIRHGRVDAIRSTVAKKIQP